MEERLPESAAAAGMVMRDESQDDGGGGGVITGTQMTLSKEWVPPPRMKPGRKAMNRPSSKRQEQNRQAQKAFRDRKAARIAELEEENDGLRAEIGELSSSVRQLTKKVTELARINQTLMLSTSFNTSTQVATPSPSPPSASPSPSDLQDIRKRVFAEPSHKAKRQEIDFTTRQPNYMSSSATGEESAVLHLVDECGFCSRGGPCVCREDEVAAPIEPAIQEVSDAGPPASYMPGTCLQCLGDPTGQLFCRSMALRTNSYQCQGDLNGKLTSSSNLMPVSQVYRSLEHQNIFNRASMDEIVETLLPGAHGTSIDSATVLNAIDVLNSKFAQPT